MIFPKWSIITTRSPSPSKAIPKSALCFKVASLMVLGCVEPTSRLILNPSGSLPIAITSAPSSENILGAT